MLNWLWGLLLLGAAVAPLPATASGVGCTPGYAYTDWEQTKEARKYEGTWVVAYKHYQRTKTEVCSNASTLETKVEGPFQLWPATPHHYMESVSGPKGDTTVSGTPLRTSDPLYANSQAQVGPQDTAATTTTAKKQASTETQPPPPAGVWLVAGALGGLIAHRRKMGLGGAVAFTGILVALFTRTTHANTGDLDHIPFNARLGPIPEGYVPETRLEPPPLGPGEPVAPPASPSFGLSWFSQALNTGLKSLWMPLALMAGAFTVVFGDPGKWVQTAWGRVTGARTTKPTFRPLWMDGDEHLVSYEVQPVEGNFRAPGLVTPSVPPPGMCEEQDPIDVALARGFSLETIYYYGPAFWRQAVNVEYQPWEIDDMNRLAANGLAMGWSFQDVDRADQELAAITAYIVGFVAGSDAYEGDSDPETYGAIAGDTTAGFVAYGDARDLVIQGYRKTTGREVDKAIVSFALVGLLLELGWVDGVIPDPADGLNGALSGVKSAFKKLPDPVRKVFAGVQDAFDKAPNKPAFAKDVAEAILWASRNPNTADRMVQSGKGLDDLIQIAKNTPKLDSEKLAKNMLAQNPNLVQKPGHAAHHIVAGNHKRAEEARRILEKFGIDINAAENGVFLPGSRQVMNGEAYHPSLHTDTYFDEVFERLRNATTREEVIDELRRVADELSKGTFPR